ncbi:hypothetical protein HII31_06862 [Pseudocercospora fuligena]|uniref:Uncharacterized protein n=1 Tax=Pseudocercospora fuligena TaxID=685502 RepID=A0A8H6VIM9_9PEZI|nr:hypothetical protein HII31_06862 [Pseudocercospora fuligena]
MGDEENAAMPNPELAREAMLLFKPIAVKVKGGRVEVERVYDSLNEALLALTEQRKPIAVTKVTIKPEEILRVLTGEETRHPTSHEKTANPERGSTTESREKRRATTSRDEPARPKPFFRRSKSPPLYTIASLDEIRARATTCPLEDTIAELMADPVENISGQTWRPIMGPLSPEEPHVSVKANATTRNKQKVAFSEQDQVQEFYRNEVPPGVAGPSLEGTLKHVSHQVAKPAAGEDVPQTLVPSKRKRDQHGPVQPAKKSRGRNEPSPFYTVLPFRQPVPAPGSWYEHIVPRTKADWESLKTENPNKARMYSDIGRIEETDAGISRVGGKCRRCVDNNESSCRTYRDLDMIRQYTTFVRAARCGQCWANSWNCEDFPRPERSHTSLHETTAALTPVALTPMDAEPKCISGARLPTSFRPLAPKQT